MPSMDATYYADCEIIIRTFEKSAAFSSDPRSVYALSTPLIQKGIANAEVTVKQIDYQLENSERKKQKNAGTNDPTNTDRNASDADESQNTSAQRESKQEKESDTPVTDWWNNIGQEDSKGWQLEDCIPCAERIKGAELAVNGIGDELADWANIIEENLKGIVNQMLSLLEMFKDQGRSALIGLCQFWESIKLIRCPSDVMRIIAALSAALTKISIDLLGELGMMLNLAKAILTPILSSLVQLIKNFLQAIIDPIHCIIDSLQKEITALAFDIPNAGQNLASMIDINAGAKSTFADQDWSLTTKAAPTGGPNSLVTREYNQGSTTQGGNLGVAQSLASGLEDKHPFQIESKEFYRDSYYKTDIQTYDEFTKLAKELEDMPASDPQRRAKQKKYDEASFNRYLKAVKDLNKSIDEKQNQFNNIFEATLFHLQDIARYLEDLSSAWIEELAKLIGGTLTVEFGFGQNGVKKLGLITLIATCQSLLEFAKSGKDRCSNEDIESAIDTAFSDTMGWLLKKEEDGSLTIFGQNIESSADPDATFEELTATGDAGQDAYIDRAAQALTAPPTAVSFKCTSTIPQDADANQINEWISQLNETKL